MRHGWLSRLVTFCLSTSIATGAWCSTMPAARSQQGPSPSAFPGSGAPQPVTVAPETTVQQPAALAPEPATVVPPGYGTAPPGSAQPEYAPQSAGGSLPPGLSTGPVPGPDWTYPYQRPGSGHVSLPPRGGYSLPTRGGYAGAPYTPDGLPTYPSPYGQMFPQSGTGYAAPGYVLPLILATAISSRSSKDGDHVEATVSRNRPLQGYGYIPAGAMLLGQITYVKHAGFMEKQGGLSVAFTELKLPDGRTFQVSGHLLGGLGPVGSGGIPYADQRGGVGWQHRMENIGVTSLLGEAVSAGAGIGYGYPMGANFLPALTSPSTFLGLMEVAGSALKRGQQIIIPAGQNFQFQLDTALTIPAETGPQTAAGY